MKSNSYLKKVREQYEKYPYPPFDPNLEKETFTFSVHDLVDAVNFHCFEGKRDFTKSFRVLIAGGGTGTSTITWAEQLRNTNNEVVYLDMTQASMDICRRRAEIRGLSNIRWFHDSILNIPNLNLGKFDFICCTGVLHHLKSPEQGLAILRDALKDDGAMLLMVYAKYGRSAIYGLQKLMRHINRDEEDLQQQVNNCKSILQGLGNDHWLKFNSDAFSGDLSSDNGIYDLLLHSQDRAYTVAELYGFIQDQGLHLYDLFPSQHLPAGLVYDPANYIKDPGLLRKIQQMGLQDIQGICEILNGRITMHECYVGPTTRNKLIPLELDLIPSFSVWFGDAHLEQLYKTLKDNQPNIILGGHQASQISMQKTPHTSLLLKYVDGKRSIREIFHKTINHPSVRKSQNRPNNQSLAMEFEYLFKYLNMQYMMYLKDKSVPAYRSIQSMQLPICEQYGTRCGALINES